MIVVFWPITGFSLLPIATAAVAWLVMMLLTRWTGFFWRHRIRRAARPVIGLVALIVLTVQAGLWAWLLAIGLWLVLAGVTDTLRARHRLLKWVLSAVGRSCRTDPAAFHVRVDEWDGLRLTFAEVDVPSTVATENPQVREQIGQAVQWALRHAGTYTLAWPPGQPTFQITAHTPLPSNVYDQRFDQVPGIPIGVTDPDSADGVVDTIDAETGDVLASLPLKIVDPSDSQRHYLVVGGTGGGKTQFLRGLIARGLRLGFWPGGVFIFDGKGGSDYIVFEGRDGVHCVAREPEDWAAQIPVVSNMMRARYDADAEFERGNRPEPDHPRYLVVLDEVQEIRSVLGKNEVDPFLQRISRQMRASEGRLMLGTQRPDAADAIPGAVKDMLEDVIVLGYISAVGAREALGQDWRAVVDEYGAESVPGRGMARLGGRLARLQSLRLDTPRKHPEVEHLYPPKLAAEADHGSQSATQLPDNVARWSPRKPPDQDAENGTQPSETGEVDPTADTAPHGIPRIGLATTPQAPEQSTEDQAPEQTVEEPPQAAGDEQPPQSRPRRRRTV